MKKLAAMLIGAIMALMPMAGSALAADYTLSDFPAPFVENNVANFMLVVGSGGSATGVANDLAGLINVAARLGGETVTTEGGEGDVSISDGVLLEASANKLNYGEAFSSVDTKLTKDDLPTLLPDEEVKDDGGTNSGTEYQYDQELYLGGDSITYLTGVDEDEYVVNTDLGANEIPVLGVDTSAGNVWYLIIDFDTALDAPDLDNSETIEILGTTFTFDPTMTSTDGELTMYAAEVTETVGVGEAKTITTETGTVTLEVIGANTEATNPAATVKVNGETEQVTEGETVSAGGETVYINQIFMQTIPVESAQVEFFVGSDKIVIDESSSYRTVEVGGDDVDGVDAAINFGGTADIDAIDTIRFRFVPSDMEDDHYKYLEIGECVMDPLFGSLKMCFDSSVPELEGSKHKVEIQKSSSDLEFNFKNRDGSEYSVTPYTGTGSVINKHTDWYGLSGTYNSVDDGKIIVLQEGSAASSYITKIYEIYDVDTGDTQVTFRDLADGDKIVVDDGDQVEDTGAYVHIVDSDTVNLTNSTGNGFISVSTDFYTKNDMKIALGAAGTLVNLTFTEGQASNNDETTQTVLTSQISSDSNSKVRVGAPTKSSGGTFASGQDDDSKVEYGLDEYGVYTETDVDNYGSYLYMWVPEAEQYFNLFFAPSDATVSGSTGGDVSRSGVIKSNVAAVDSDVTSAQKSSYHLILGGGSCVNKLTAEALGLTYPTCGAESGIPEDGYMIKLVPNAFVEGKHALVIAGWESEQTTEAMAKVQANMEDVEDTVFYYPEEPEMDEEEDDTEDEEE